MQLNSKTKTFFFFEGKRKRTYFNTEMFILSTVLYFNKQVALLLAKINQQN